MNQLKIIKDNSYYSKSEFSKVNAVIDRVADKTLEQLELDGVFVFGISRTEDLSNEQMILQGCNGQYRSGNVIGFLGVDDESLIIQSRFSTGSNDYFFQYLLCKVLDFPDLINLETEVNQQDKLFNLLLFLFTRYLKQAARKGLFKTYIRKEYNNDNVRGTIDVATHIIKNTPFTGNISYFQREYSTDNYLIELVRHTIEYIKCIKNIKGEPLGQSLLNLVKAEVKLVSEATPNYKKCERRKIIESNQKNIVRHAFYHEYRALQQICILILRNELHQYGVGTRKVYGILFDGAWLWEEYVNKLICDKFYHPRNKRKQGVQSLFTGKNGDKIGRIYPDFISNKDANERVIADAKYKRQDGIRGQDYQQLLAYMFRFDAKKGFYLYPHEDKASKDLTPKQITPDSDDVIDMSEDKVLYLNTGSTYEENVKRRDDVVVIKHGLLIPNDAVDYKDFVTKMESNENKFVRDFF